MLLEITSVPGFVPQDRACRIINDTSAFSTVRTWFANDSLQGQFRSRFIHHCIIKDIEKMKIKIICGVYFVRARRTLQYWPIPNFVFAEGKYFFVYTLTRKHLY